MAGPLLTGDQRMAFERDIAGQSADDTPPVDDAPEGGTTTPTEEPPAPPARGQTPVAPPSGSPRAPAPRGTTPPAAPPSTPPAGASSEPDFDTLQKNPAFAAKLDEIALQKAQEYVETIAMRSPQAYEFFYKQKPPAGLFAPGGAPSAAPAGAPPGPQKPEDMIAAVRSENEQLAKRLANFEQERALERLGDAIQEQFDRHENVFTHKVWGNDAQNMATYEIRQAIMRNPRADLGKIVDSVAQRYKSYETHVQSQYVESKKGAAKTVPAGAGPSGAPVPGEPKTKLNLGRGKNGTQNALTAHIAAMNANNE